MEPLTITSTNIGAGSTRGVNYSQQMTSTGGTGSVTWALDSGSLPPRMGTHVFGSIERSGYQRWNLYFHHSRYGFWKSSGDCPRTIYYDHRRASGNYHLGDAAQRVRKSTVLVYRADFRRIAPD